MGKSRKNVSELPIYRTPEDLPMVMKTVDVMAFMRVSEPTALEYINSAGFPRMKIGREYRIPKMQFLEWWEQHVQKKLEIA